MTRMFVPGPVDVPPEVLQKMTKPMLPHRSKEYEEIHRHAAEKAQNTSSPPMPHGRLSNTLTTRTRLSVSTLTS